MKTLTHIAAFCLGILFAMLLARLGIEALIHEVNVQERQALDAQGREAWDRYCYEVFIKNSRPDDLDAQHAECSRVEWSYFGD